MGSSPSFVALDQRPRAASSAGCADRGFRPLALWHLLSLDAPTVAATWTWFIARCCGISLSTGELMGMFIAVWILYATDRLLDSSARSTSNPRSTIDLKARHSFHAIHRRSFLGSLPIAVLALGLCVLQFPHRELALDLLLAALLISWFAVIHVAARSSSLPLPKELAVGAFFAAAIFVPAIARQPHLQFATLVAAIFFGLLCTLNGLYIHRWEHAPVGLADHASADTDSLTGWLLNRLPLAALLCLLVPLAAAVLQPDKHSLPEYAVSLSALALITLNRCRHNLEATTLRALADVALLSPLLLAPLVL